LGVFCFTYGLFEKVDHVDATELKSKFVKQKVFNRNMYSLA